MNTKILSLFILTVLATTTLSAKARIPVCFPCEQLETTMDLTDDETLEDMAGSEVNLAYFYNEYGLLWTSVWNADGRYVLSDTSNNTYWEIDEELAQYLKDNHDFDVNTAGSPLSFWKKIGGKILLVLVLVFLFWGNSDKKKKKVKPSNI